MMSSPHVAFSCCLLILSILLCFSSTAIGFSDPGKDFRRTSARGIAHCLNSESTDPMYHNQMTYNGLPSSSSPPPFFSPGFLFHSSVDENHHLPSLQCANPQDYGGGVEAAVAMMGKRSVWSEEMAGGGGGEEEELSDDCSHPGEKKRRLNIEQVRTLERSFELGNKLEPERKLQLARALGLQPRQIAIWFQNRRARWKTKQLEKDYEALKREFDIVKSQNDALHAHNQKLQSEMLALKGREGTEPINLNRETHDQGSSSNRSENSSDINWDITRSAAIGGPMTPINQSSRQFFSSDRAAPNVAVDAKVENGGGRAGGSNDENLCNIFCSVADEPPAFWQWSEH